MAKPPLPPAVVELLKRPNPAVIGVVRPDGAPVTVATWYLWDDSGEIIVNMDAGRRRLAYLRREPRVSLTVLDDDWMTHVSVQGQIVALAEDQDLVMIDKLAKHYTGKPYRNRDRPRVTGWMEIETWHAWGRLRG